MAELHDARRLDQAHTTAAVGQRDPVTVVCAGGGQVRCATRYLQDPGSRAGLAVADRRVLWWPRWLPDQGGGAGVTVGLIEGDYNPAVTDLDCADITVGRFGADRPGATWLREHGSFSAALLVGQGTTELLGVVPAARLLIACTASLAGDSHPDAVREAVAWLATHAAVIVIPLGRHDDHPGLAAALRDAAGSGSVVVAAAGNRADRPVLFPARADGCLAVGACTAAGALLPPCPTSPCLDMVVRGDRVTAPVAAGSTRCRSGTSVACVLAGGLLAAAISHSLLDKTIPSPRHPAPPPSAQPIGRTGAGADPSGGRL
ncbi:S8 family serine peptidase [Nocardia gipuzkoensis]